MTNWWYLDGKEKIGPVSQSDLLYLARERKSAATTKLWRPGLDTWTPLEDIPKKYPEKPEEPRNHRLFDLGMRAAPSQVSKIIFILACIILTLIFVYLTLQTANRHFATPSPVE